MAKVGGQVRSGEGLAIEASQWNDVREMLSRPRSGNAPRGGLSPLGPLVVTVQNLSGGDVPRFGILGLGGTLFDPSAGDETELAFQNSPLFQGNSPVDSDRDWILITQEPIADNGIGSGLLLGATPVRIEINDAAHQSAIVVEGETGYLTSSDWGPVRILWKESGSSGVKWALVETGVPWIGPGVISGPLEFDLLNGWMIGDRLVDAPGAPGDEVWPAEGLIVQAVLDRYGDYVALPPAGIVGVLTEDLTALGKAEIQTEYVSSAGTFATGDNTPTLTVFDYLGFEVPAGVRVSCQLDTLQSRWVVNGAGCPA